MREGDRVYTVLRDKILQWELGPGAVLAEVEISKELGVSRTPVREALRHLEREKLVQIRQGRGAMVSEISMHNIAQIFQIAPVPGIWTSGPLAFGPTKCESGLRSRTAP